MINNQGENHPAARLTVPDVLAIRADPRFHRDIARDFGIAESTVSGIRRGFTWKHVPMLIGQTVQCGGVPCKEIVVTVSRRCLKCGDAFESWGNGNRLCEEHGGQGREMEEYSF